MWYECYSKHAGGYHVQKAYRIKIREKFSMRDEGNFMRVTDT